MCGIFAIIGQDAKASGHVLEGLKLLEYRGYDSWGIASTSNRTAKIKVVKKTGKIGTAQLKNTSLAHMAIGHTRWATHGGVTVNNAHPHLDCSKTIALIHNGIVENYTELKTRLVKKGHKFVSQTDSEVIVHLIEEYEKSNTFSQAVQNTFEQLKGMNALVIINSKEKKLYTIKNGSPLVIGKAKHSYLVASDVSALLSHTSQVQVLQDRVLAEIDEVTLQLKDTTTSQILTSKWQEIKSKIESIQLGEYSNYQIKEIHEQPDILTTISNWSQENITKFTKSLKRKIVFSGCGTAYHAALAGKYFLAHFSDQSADTYPASELQNFLKTFDSNTSFVFLSQSGETADIIENAKKITSKGTKISAITNSPHSTLAYLSSNNLFLQCGPELCVLATKSFTSKLALLILIAATLAKKFPEAQKQLRENANDLKQLISDKYYNSHLKKLIHFLQDQQHVYIIGRGVDYPIALEIALKIKEGTYIHAEAFAAGELKHGVLALIESKTPCIVVATNQEEFDNAISSATQIKSRGGIIVGISINPHPVFDYYLPIADNGITTTISATVVGQLIAYYLCMAKGLDPDKPRNLAKSVTVK